MKKSKYYKSQTAYSSYLDKLDKYAEEGNLKAVNI
jgi:soluble cytochrome b562